MNISYIPSEMGGDPLSNIASPPRLEEEKGNKMNDNRVDLTYVADRLMRITEISDRRKMEKAIEEFREECLRNIGVNVVNEYNES